MRISLEEGGEIYPVFYNWADFKNFIIIVMIVLLVIVSTIIILIMNYTNSRKSQEMKNTIEAMRLKAQRHEQLLQMESQRKSDLITYLAHDMRTPLASVIGYLSLLDEVPEMPAEQKARYVGITLDKAYRLEQLIEEFFDVTRFNLQTIVLNKQKIDLKLLLQQMADEFYPLVEPGGKSIKVETPDTLLYKGDGDKLARVFNNIIKNAVSYSYNDTAIIIRATEENGSIVTEVISQGDTIPEHQQKQIFEKFFRLDSSRSTQTGGAGLGLAIAKEIVDAHGGMLSVKSDESATVFTVSLPMD
ncbi:MAG: HAMP domain-containing histidine kinase [Firmicutes bacterium]|nr:HAMP domain-containing histidine kinase [Bacillota bacterium]